MSSRDSRASLSTAHGTPDWLLANRERKRKRPNHRGPSLSSVGGALLVASCLVGVPHAAECGGEVPELLWVRVEDWARSQSLATDSEGNVITMAMEMDHANTVIVKYDRDGDLLWRKEMDLHYQRAMCTDHDDNIIILTDTLIVKVDPEGEEIWSLGLGSQIASRAVSCDPIGNIFVAGSWLGIVTVKVTAAGEMTWRREGGGVWGSACAADGQGDVIVGGVDLVGGDYDWWIVKYNPDGDSLWVRTYGGPYDDEPSGICVDGNNNVYVAGGWLVKYDPEGNVIWENPTSEFSFGCLSCDGAANIYASGWIRAGDTWYPGWGCFDLEGQPSWMMRAHSGCDGGAHFPACSGIDRLAVLQTSGDANEATTAVYTLAPASGRRRQ